MLSALFKTMLAGMLLVLLCGCSPLKVLNSLTPTSTFTRVTDVAYGADPRNKLDIYTPVNLTGKAPVVVFFYGGSWNSGSRTDYGFVGEALASRGIVTVIADYRLYPQVRYPLFLQDSASAVAWAHDHVQAYGGDPQQLYVMGHSSGAYNAAMVALDPRLLAAVGQSPKILKGWIGLAGPYDFLPIENPEVKPVFFFPNSPPDSQPINHVAQYRPRPCCWRPTATRWSTPGATPVALRSNCVTMGCRCVSCTFHAPATPPWSLPFPDPCAAWRRCWMRWWRLFIGRMWPINDLLEILWLAAIYCLWSRANHPPVRPSRQAKTPRVTARSNMNSMNVSHSPWLPSPWAT